MTLQVPPRITDKGMLGMKEIEDNDEEQLAMEFMIATSTALNFTDEAELYPDTLLQTLEESCSCSDYPRYAYDDDSNPSVLSPYYPSENSSSIPSQMETQPTPDTQSGDLVKYLQPMPQILCSGEQQEQTNHLLVTMPFKGDKCSPEESVGQLLNAPPPPPSLPHPPQSVTQSFYDCDDRFLLTMDSAAEVKTMDSIFGGMYNGGIGLSLCSGGDRRTVKSFFPSDVEPMQFPVTEYQPMPVGVYNLQNSFQMQAYASNNLQLPLDTPLQKRQTNSSLLAVCSGTPPLASGNSSFDKSTFKVERLSGEEKKRKIERYLMKKKARNFSKTIKYECRKSLADSRPRVRGRFVKNAKLGERESTSTIIQDYEDDDDDDQVINKEEDSFYL